MIKCDEMDDSNSCLSPMSTTITLLKSTQDIAPKRWFLTAWADFVALFATARQTGCTLETCGGCECLHKRGACWSPATFVGEGARRRKDVVSVSLLVFDIERGTNNHLRLLQDHLSGCRHIVHATHSDRPDCRAMRVIVALSRAVQRDEWPRFWNNAVAKIAPSTNPTYGDPSQIYFLPSRPTGSDYFFAVLDGQSLDVDAMLRLSSQV